MPKLPFLLLACSLSLASLSASVITGTSTNWIQGTALTVGDGTNSVGFVFSAASSDWFYFYGDTDFTPTGSEAAYDSSITNYSQVTEASTANYVSGLSGSAFRYATDGGRMPGIGKYILGRNLTTGYYGILRLDAFHGATIDGKLDVTWWFQTDGTGNFSAPPPVATPEPVSFGLALAGLGVMVRARRVCKAR